MPGRTRLQPLWRLGNLDNDVIAVWSCVELSIHRPRYIGTLLLRKMKYWPGLLVRQTALQSTDTVMKETTEQQQQHQVTSSSARPWVRHQTLTTWPPTQQSHFCSNFYSLIVCGDKNVVGQLCGRAVPDSPGCYNGGDQCTAVAMWPVMWGRDPVVHNLWHTMGPFKWQHHRLMLHCFGGLTFYWLLTNSSIAAPLTLNQ